LKIRVTVQVYFEIDDLVVLGHHDLSFSSLNLMLDSTGTVLQRSVWRALQLCITQSTTKGERLAIALGQLLGKIPELERDIHLPPQCSSTLATLL